jgi:hypothetical protein
VNDEGERLGVDVVDQAIEALDFVGRVRGIAERDGLRAASDEEAKCRKPCAVG